AGRVFTESEASPERGLPGWSHSCLGIKRAGFHGMKRLVLFLTYAKVLDGGVSPNWASIVYAGPPSAESPLARHPSEVRIEPLKPTGETALDADVCVVGSGAGGSVIAAKLAEAGYRVIVLEAGSYRTAATFRQREAEAYDTMFQGHGVLTTTDLAFSVLAGQTAGGSPTTSWMTS